MASGKSTVGPILAERLGWDFVDFDDVIARREGRSPGRLIREEGEPAFRALEARITAEHGDRRGVVLAPGGGWAMAPELAASLGPGTVRVWLRVSPEEAVRRAESEGTDRPLMGPPEGRVERMTRLLERRMERYAAAELSVDVDELQPGAVADAIVRRLGLATGGE
jgi:shikimate kinase